MEKLIFQNFELSQELCIYIIHLPVKVIYGYWNILITLILLNTYHGFVLVDFFPMLQNWGFNLVMYISQVVLILYIMRTHRILEAQVAEAHPLICAEIQFRWLSRIVVSQRGQR